MEQYKRQLQLASWLLVAVLALGSLWLLRSIDHMDDARAAGSTIMVSGSGKVSAKPDVAVGEFAISVERDTAQNAQDEASRKSKSVVEYLKKAGIEEKDIRTSGYNIYPQYDYANGRSTIRGYQVTQSLTVKVRDLDKANDILDGVVGAGVNQVNSVQFTIDDADKLKAEAREKAIADAKEKARELRGQLGVRLGRIVSFSENTGGYPVPMYDMKAENVARGMGGGGGPELPTGENEITVNVSITYEIK